MSERIRRLVIVAFLLFFPIALERIRIDRTRFWGSINPVNPVHLIKPSRFTRLMGSPMAILINHDLL